MANIKQQRSDRTLTVFVVMAAGMLLVVGLLVLAKDDPESRVRQLDRQKVEAWCSIQDDELQELAVRREAREQCDRMRRQFRAQWGHSP